MKKQLIFLLAIVLLLGCKKKEEGNLICQVQFTSTGSKSMINSHENPKSGDDGNTLYTQFGDYICSITPYRFSTKIMGLGFSDNKVIFDGGHKLQLIHGETPNDDPQRYVDFSNNSTVSFIPTYSGGTDDFFDIEEIEFIYFGFSFFYLSQEMIIPSQYDTVNLAQFNGSFGNNTYFSDSVKHGNVLKVDHFPLFAKIFNCDTLGWLTDFVFGNTDSTRVVYLYAGQTIPELDAVCNGVMIGPKNPFIWSDKYESFKLSKPPDGETVSVNTTVSFNTTDLIQVYAGADNIPYTGDDLFVYAPKFWERISVNVTIE